jgi:rifampin ADP-ribosylating transferase
MITQANDNPSGLFFHGTRADLEVGDLLTPGFVSNYGQRDTASWIYLTATLDAAIWGGELAAGEGRERIYIVEPTGEIFDDPISPTRNIPAIRPGPIARGRRFGSRAKSRSGKAIRPNGLPR